MSPASTGRREEPRGLLAPTLLAMGLASASLAVFVAASGGFRLAAGWLKLSIRSPWLAAWTAVALAGLAMALAPRSARAHTGRVAAAIERRASWLAAAIALLTLAVGYFAGSVVPSGADASGYLSQAALWRRGDLRLREPAILDAPWPEPAWTYSPLGYRPGETAGELVPTYPPGLPLQYAAATAVGGEAGTRALLPVLGALGVFLLFVLGRRVAGGLTGLAAATFLASSPAWLVQLVQPMSDVPVTTWWLLVVLLACARSSPAAFGSGLAAGVALLTRPNLVPLLAVVVTVLVWPRRASALPLHHAASPRTWTRTACFAAGLLPAAAVLAWFNASLYGAPWRSGYGEASSLFSLSNVTANARLYGGWLLEVHSLLLALALVGVIALLRDAPSGRWRASGLGGTAVVVVSCYLPYAPFENWTYLRFLLPAIAALSVLAAVSAARAASTVPTLGPVMLLLVLAGVAGDAAATARERGVFSLASREQRYATAAAWVRTNAPPDTPLLAAQHSGSLRFLTGRTVIRWDLLDRGRSPAATSDPSSAPVAWLDIAWRGHDAEPPSPNSAWLIVDAEEEQDFRRRFADVSELGRLDWPPAAASDPPQPVRVYRLEDRQRYRQGAPVVTDRMAPPRR